MGNFSELFRFAEPSRVCERSVLKSRPNLSRQTREDEDEDGENGREGKLGRRADRPDRPGERRRRVEGDPQEVAKVQEHREIVEERKRLQEEKRLLERPVHGVRGVRCQRSDPSSKNRR